MKKQNSINSTEAKNRPKRRRIQATLAKHDIVGREIAATSNPYKMEKK